MTSLRVQEHLQIYNVIHLHDRELTFQTNLHYPQSISDSKHHHKVTDQTG